MTDSLAARLAELERARQDADRLYNAALTALDRALPARPAFPDPPPAYDETKLPDLNAGWNILPTGAPAIDRSLKGRLRGLVWRLVGPPLEAQRQFNAALVEHLNRNVAAHAESARGLAGAIAVLRNQIEADLMFQSHLIQLLQTVTLYVDTKDRSVAGAHEVLNAGLSAVTDTWMKHWASLSARDARLLERVSAIDDLRATAALAQQTSLSLKREVEKLLARTPGAPGGAGASASAGAPAVARASAAPGQPGEPPDLDAFTYLGFEDQFRGSIDDIRRRLEAYVPLFAGQTDVLDIGCGRGEFLDLLRDAGIPARGLDVNLAMVEASRARGLNVDRGDALTHLRGLPDASLGGLFAAQVVEHLPPDYLMALLETAAHKMRPGGVLVLETINPACWAAFFESYIRDLTHVRPLHPETLQYLARVSGFQDVRIRFTSPIAEADRLHPLRPFESSPAAVELNDIVERMNENLEKLNARMFTYQDYAVVGRR